MTDLRRPTIYAAVDAVLDTDPAGHGGIVVIYRKHFARINLPATTTFRRLCDVIMTSIHALHGLHAYIISSRSNVTRGVTAAGEGETAA